MKTSRPTRSTLRTLNWTLEWFSHRVTDWVGSSWAFGVAVLLILIWAVTGPIFDYSETWQLIINTGTTIITFLMVFLIQRSQNKESLAVEVKLNELLAAQQGASNELINAEEMSEEEIRELHKQFRGLAAQLQAAADDRSPHSITEAHEAVHRLHRSFSRRSREPDSGHAHSRPRRGRKSK